ncbi:MAG: molecular chaperone DnaJ, partial [Rubritepida sp.]|nr:molecular chaperone DnaJ [Rubritepida sp.]
LEAWLDRTHPDWREAAPPPRAPSSGAMNRAEAFAVLGLQDGASAADIRAAHRRLMQAAHPDHGGSDWLASRVNEARDFLLG